MTHGPTVTIECQALEPLFAQEVDVDGIDDDDYDGDDDGTDADGNDNNRDDNVEHDPVEDFKFGGLVQQR
jgi:hypothetical protein